jgi:hypothetical protein
LVPSALHVSGGSAAATQAVRGEYRLSGDAHGHPRYQRRVSEEGSPVMLYLYRTVYGKWAFAATDAQIARSKGRVVSALNASSPAGIGFRFWEAAGKWPKDSTLAVGDASPCEPDTEGPTNDNEDPDLPELDDEPDL